MKKIVLIGAGGHAKSVIEAINSTKGYKIIGLIDKNKKSKFEKYKILGNDKFLEKKNLIRKYYFLVTIGQIKNYKIREKIFNILKKKKIKNCYYNIKKRNSFKNY